MTDLSAIIAVLNEQWPIAAIKLRGYVEEVDKLQASRDAYKRDSEGLLHVSKAAADALEVVEAERNALREEVAHLTAELYKNTKL